MNFDSLPRLRVIAKDHPTEPGASHFEVTGDYDAVQHQVAVIMNDPLVRSATFDTLPRKSIHKATGSPIWRSEGTVTVWPANSPQAPPRGL
jgi:hypothetical protein